MEAPIPAELAGTARGMRPSATSPLWQLAGALDVHERLRASCLSVGVALQGETFGEGIQGNPLRIRGSRFAAFTLRADGVEVPRGSWPAWVARLSVPVHDELPFPGSVDQALAQVEKLRSKVSPGRPVEGIVWRPPTGPGLDGRRAAGAGVVQGDQQPRPAEARPLSAPGRGMVPHPAPCRGGARAGSGRAGHVVRRARPVPHLVARRRRGPDVRVHPCRRPWVR